MILTRSQHSLEKVDDDLEEAPTLIFSSQSLVSPDDSSSLPISSALYPYPAETSLDIAHNTMMRLTREQQIKRAVFRSFGDLNPAEIDQLRHLSSRGWRKLLSWMNISGLALYFFDRSVQLGFRDAIPPEIIDRLQQSVDDNTKRTHGMIAESIAIQREFQKNSLSYAVMKGISLSPSSVPRPELRHQFDLDYLIAEEDAPAARRILEQRGYRLYAISGKSWEFKINETPNITIKDLYKNLPYRAVELHLETNALGHDSRLGQMMHREMFGIMMPVFSPVDLFLGQAMHAFKDVCSAFSRTSHLLEFYRHILNRRDDDTFWRELRSRVGQDRKACFGLGVVTRLTTSIMGDFAPVTLTEWTADALPPAARLWVDLYGHRTAFGKHPGTKFYLFLQRELEASGMVRTRPIIQSLLPSSLPPLVVRSSSGETLRIRISRYRLQARYLFSRLRFHIVEGIRYAMESHRWRKFRKQLSS